MDIKIGDVAIRGPQSGQYQDCFNAGDKIIVIGLRGNGDVEFQRQEDGEIQILAFDEFILVNQPIKSSEFSETLYW